jgi:hypothetical protein
MRDSETMSYPLTRSDAAFRELSMIVGHGVKEKGLSRVGCALACAMLQGLGLLSGCVMVIPSASTITYYDFGAGMPILRPLDSYPIKVIVQDLRPEVLSRRRTPLFVGSAENGMGERRDVFNRDDCPVPVSVHSTPHCRTLAESMSLRLKSPESSPQAGPVKGLVIVEIKEWATQASADDVFQINYTLELYLRSLTGETLASSTVSGQGERIDVSSLGAVGFFNHTEREEQLSAMIAGVFDAKIKALLTNPVQNALRHLRQ